MSLVLTRREGDEVVITAANGARLIVKVTSVIGNKIRLGFTGDEDEFEINRAEVQALKDAR